MVWPIGEVFGIASRTEGLRQGRDGLDVVTLSEREGSRKV